MATSCWHHLGGGMVAGGTYDGHLIIVTEDSGYNKDGDLVTGDSMNCSVYNVHCSSTSVASLCDQTALPAIPLPGTAAPCLHSSVLSSHRISGWPGPRLSVPCGPRGSGFSLALVCPRVQCSGRISPGNDNITLLTPSFLANPI